MTSVTTQARQFESLTGLGDQRGSGGDDPANVATRFHGAAANWPDRGLADASRGAAPIAAPFATRVADPDASPRLLVLTLYAMTAAANALGVVPAFAWVSLLLWVTVAAVAARQRRTVAGTLFHSHFGNIATTALLSGLGYVALLFATLGNFGLGLVITLPLGIALAIWSAFRIVAGLFLLARGKAV